MKTIFLLLMMGCLLSCNGNSGSANYIDVENSPSSVAVAFRTNLVQGNLDEAREFGTDSTRRLLDHMAIHRPLVENYRISLIEESINNDRAFVLLRENDSDSLTKIQLVKEGGQWKVDLIASLRNKNSED